MNRRTLLSASAVALLTAALAPLGCSPPAPQALDLGPTVVSVAEPVVRDNVDSEDFTGRTEAVKSVDVKARATGYLKKVMFEDGEIVKAGRQLYQIDDRTYLADVNKIKSDISRIQASVERQNADLGRARQMRIGDAISREEYDKIVASRDEANASLGATKQELNKAELNLLFTKVYAEIDGKISRTKITEGNLVTADTTSLTTLVSVEPMYAYFDIDERTVLQIQQMIREEVSPAGVEQATAWLASKKITPGPVVELIKGRLTPAARSKVRGLIGDEAAADEFDRLLRANPKFKGYRDAKIPVYLGTQLEKGYPYTGTIDFVDNKLDANTGTLRVRGSFPNKDAALTPGLFVRIRLPLGEARKVTLVAEQALGSDQGQRFLYVVNDADEVEYRAVQIGALRDGLRVIESGVKPGERVIVNGLQRVRPKAKVSPEKVPMPEPAKK